MSGQSVVKISIISGVGTTMWKHFIPSDTLDVQDLVVGSFADHNLSLP